MNVKLKIAIFENGLSQRELAKRTKIPESFISMSIHGKYNLDPVQRAKISKEIGKPESEIFAPVGLRD